MKEVGEEGNSTLNRYVEIKKGIKIKRTTLHYESTSPETSRRLNRIEQVRIDRDLYTIRRRDAPCTRAVKEVEMK